MKKVLLAIVVIGGYGQMYAQKRFNTAIPDLMKQYSVNKHQLNRTEIYVCAQQKTAKASKIATAVSLP